MEYNKQQYIYTEINLFQFHSYTDHNISVIHAGNT